MQPTVEYVYWDSCVFLSYLGHNSPDHTNVVGLLEEIRNDAKRKILTSMLSMTEVAHGASYGTGRPITAEEEAAIDELWHSPFIERVEVTERIVLDARTLMRSVAANGITGLKPMDAIHLATAIWCNAHVGHVQVIYTSDDKWHRQYAAFTNGIPVQYPIPTQPSLLSGA